MKEDFRKYEEGHHRGNETVGEVSREAGSQLICVHEAASYLVSKSQKTAIPQSIGSSVSAYSPLGSAGLALEVNAPGRPRNIIKPHTTRTSQTASSQVLTSQCFHLVMRVLNSISGSSVPDQRMREVYLSQQ